MTVEHPFTPFYVGFVLAVLSMCYLIVYGVVWKGRHNVHRPWDYDSEYQKAWAYCKQTSENFRWGVIVGTPFLCGIVLEVVWWMLAIPMGIQL